MLLATLLTAALAQPPTADDVREMAALAHPPPPWQHPTAHPALSPWLDLVASGRDPARDPHFSLTWAHELGFAQAALAYAAPEQVDSVANATLDHLEERGHRPTACEVEVASAVAGLLANGPCIESEVRTSSVPNLQAQLAEGWSAISLEDKSRKRLQKWLDKAPAAPAAWRTYVVSCAEAGGHVVAIGVAEVESGNAFGLVAGVARDGQSCESGLFEGAVPR